MSRTSRVPYHQNVYDLYNYDLESVACPDAARMIAEHEAQHGPLPFPPALREWYSSRFALSPPTKYLEPLDGLLEAIAEVGEPVKQLLVHDDTSRRTWARLDGSDDPQCYSRDYDATEWNKYPDTFSRFVIDHIIGNADWFNSNGKASVWLRTPAEPFAPPVLDFLTEQFGEPERKDLGDVAAYAFYPEGGRIRITADHLAHPNPSSAWWIDADTSARLEEFRKLLSAWGTLRYTLGRY